MKAMKITLLVLIGLPLIIGIAAIVFILTIDPNRFKPQIQAVLSEQGISSEFTGDLAWTFFPNLGIAITGLDLNNDQGHDLLALGEVSTSVEVMPLFKKQVIVSAIVVKDTTLYYTVEQSGESNWDFLATDAAAPSEPSTPVEAPSMANASANDAGTPALSLNLQSIAVENLNLNYQDIPAETKTELAGIYLKSANVNLEGRAFPLELGAAVSLEGFPKTIVSLSGDVLVDLDTTDLKLKKGALSIAPGDAKLSSELDVELNWSALSGQGKWALAKTQIPPLLKELELARPQTKNPNVLQTIAASTEFAFTDSSLKLEKIKFELDATSLVGETNISQFSPLDLSSHWQASTLNLDDYLPPAAEETATVEPPLAEPSPLPLQALRDVGLADISFKMDRLVAMNTAVEDIAITTKLAKAIVDTRVNAKVQQGSIQARSKFDAKKDIATLAFDIEAKEINLGPLLQNFADLDLIEGNANAQIAGDSKGATDIELIDNMAFKANLSSPQMVMVPFNIEQQFCNALAIAQGKQAPDYNWPKQTVMSPMETVVEYRNKTLKVEKLNASVSRLNALAKGSFNTESGKFEFPIELNLGSFAGELEGCLPISSEWRKVNVPILCKGSLEGIDYKTCLPNVKLLGKLAEQRLKAEANKKLEAEKDKAEEKLKEKAQEKLKEKFGEDKAKELENTLKGLLRGK